MTIASLREQKQTWTSQIQTTAEAYVCTLWGIFRYYRIVKNRILTGVLNEVTKTERWHRQATRVFELFIIQRQKMHWPGLWMFLHVKQYKLRPVGENRTSQTHISDWTSWFVPETYCYYVKPYIYNFRKLANTCINIKIHSGFSALS
jgi:hypothetical protein